MFSNSSNNYAAYLSKLNNNINNYVSIILPSIGIPCNLISVFIFWRLRRNKSNMVFLGIFQSVIDAILLLLVLIVFKSQFTIGLNISIQSDSICRFVTFIKRYIYICSSWMLVLITFDRVIFVLYRYQNRFKFMRNKLVLTASIFGILTFLALVNIPNLFFYLDSSSLSCTSSNIIDATTDIISIVFRTFLPFALMIVFNLLMVQKVFRNAKFKHTALSRREFQLTFAVMVFDVYFFFVNLPLSLYYIFSDVNTYSGAMNNNPVFKAQYSLANVLTSNFAFFQQTFAFFMHLTFNKLFRSEIIYLISIGVGVKSRIGPTRTASTTNTILYN